MKFSHLLGLAWAAVLCLFAEAPAHAQWLRAESPNFIVYSREPEARVRERILLLENFDRLLRRMTNVDAPPAPSKLHVYIVNGLRDLRIIRPVDNLSGFYTATQNGIAAFVDGRVETSERGVGRNRSSSENEVLFHEYAHHFMMQYSANAYPVWYIEGFAEYFSTAQFREGSVDVGNFSTVRAQWLAHGSWMPTERVLVRGRERLTEEQLAMFYAQSWLLTYHFYSTTERQQALVRYLQALREGSPAEALLNATGMTPDQLHRELRSYVHGARISYIRLPVGDAVPPQVTIAGLPPSANDLLLYEASLRVGVPDDYRTSHLERIRAAAARHSEDAYARRVRAHAEILLGDRAAAAPLLDALLAAAPADAELMYLKGLMHLGNSENAEDGEQGEAEAAEARRWFTRAHNADGNHFQTLYRYAQSLRYDQRYLSENTSNVLLLAHQLAPQVTEITLNAAANLIARRDFEGAEILLRPLASDPHNAELAELAQQMIDRARTGGAQQSEPAEASEHEGSE